MSGLVTLVAINIERLTWFRNILARDGEAGIDRVMAAIDAEIDRYPANKLSTGEAVRLYREFVPKHEVGENE